MEYTEREKEIQQLVGSILESYEAYPEIIRVGMRTHIDREAVAEAIENLRKLLFPGFFDSGGLCELTKEFFVRDTLFALRSSLITQIERAHRHADRAQPARNETSPCDGVSCEGAACSAAAAADEPDADADDAPEAGDPSLAEA